MTYYDFIIKGKINTYSEDDAIDIANSALEDAGFDVNTIHTDNIVETQKKVHK